MTIKFADQRVREARQRIVALDRELAQLPKAFLALPADDPIVKELRAENVRLANERNGAYRELPGTARARRERRARRWEAHNLGARY